MLSSSACDMVSTIEYPAGYPKRKFVFVKSSNVMKGYFNNEKSNLFPLDEHCSFSTQCIP